MREAGFGALGSEGARGGESEVAFVDVLSGGELHRLGAVWLGADVETALAACRAEHSQGRVASAEGARDASLGQNRGRGRWFGQGHGVWGGLVSTPAARRRRRERETEEK